MLAGLGVRVRHHLRLAAGQRPDVFARTSRNKVL
jgi:hypothetical protein